MSSEIKTILLTATLLFSAACSKTSDSAAVADGEATSATALSLYMNVYSAAPGGSVTITASGGSGTYSSATASEGSVYQSSNGTFVYTAPASALLTLATITVTDSLGTTGQGFITLTGSSTTTNSTSSLVSCAGTYSATIGGNAATVVLVDDSGGYLAGYIHMFSYYYPIFGSCSNNGVSGSISFSDLVNGWTYTGTTSYASGVMSLAGSLVAAGSTYSWTGTSQSTPVNVVAAVNTCEGNYNTVIAGNAGTMVLVQDGYNRVAGYLQLQGYFYALSGTCNGTGGSVSFSNVTSGSPYTGTVAVSASSVTMSGTFTTTAGSTYNWSATKY